MSTASPRIRPIDPATVDNNIKTYKIMESIELLKQDLTYIRTSIDEISDQVKYTNGRVTKMEKWRAYATGFGTCITIIILPIAFMIISKGLDNLL